MTADPVSVRPQRDEDIDAVAALNVASWRAVYPGIFPDDVLAALDPAAIAARRRGYTTIPDVHTLVAVRDGAVVGFVTFGPYRRRRPPADLDQTRGEVNALYVHPDHWGTGAGRALFVAALDAFPGREVRVWVAEANHRARRFYERAGLTPDGRREMFRLDRPDGTEPVEVPEVRYHTRGPAGSGGP